MSRFGPSVYCGGMRGARIRAVAFDAVGTLFHSRGTVGDIYRSVALKYGIDVTAMELQAGFTRETTANGTPVDRADWKRLVETVFLEHGPFPGFDQFFEEVYIFFQSGQSWMCYPETTRVLEALRNQDYKLAVVSNFDRRLLDVLRDLQIGDHFAAVVTPDSAGEAKPDPRIFIDATVQLEVLPAEILFVGDDPSLDVRAARAAGLESVLVDRDKSGPQAGAISDLSGVFPILGAA
jgi:putative hydrolase of the HAD superfamily